MSKGLVGNKRFMLGKGLQIPSTNSLETEEKLGTEGKTVVFVSAGFSSATSHRVFRFDSHIR